MPKFKVGDKVKLIKKLHGSRYNIGDILTLKASGYNPKWQCEEIVDGRRWHVAEEEIELVKELQPHYKQYIGKKYAVHCKTQGEWDRVREALEKVNIMVTPTKWRGIGEDMEYLCLDYYLFTYNYWLEKVGKDKGYTILSVAEFFGEEEKQGENYARETTIGIDPASGGDKTVWSVVESFRDDHFKKCFVNEFPLDLGFSTTSTAMSRDEKLTEFDMQNAVSLLSHKPINKNNIIKKTMTLKEVPSKLKKIFDKDTRDNFKVGFLREDLTLSASGQDELFDILYEKKAGEKKTNKELLADRAREIIKEYEAEQKNSK